MCVKCLAPSRCLIKTLLLQCIHCVQAEFTYVVPESCIDSQLFAFICIGLLVPLLGDPWAV